MPDEHHEPEIPVEMPSRKTALEWVYRALMAAAFFYLQANYVPRSVYEHDLEKREAHDAIIMKELQDLNLLVSGVSNKLSNMEEARRDIRDLDGRVRVLEKQAPYTPAHP